MRVGSPPRSREAEDDGGVAALSILSFRFLTVQACRVEPCMREADSHRGDLY